ncbi:uncharacterized protein A4U43_C07F1260 [Asparagus officinalis]|uniref:Mitochondrial glycoprotein family protein n=1 Tax=Asparagus officinalis TaxID=4686 RepID=A0A5P1E8F9_ASPOF|nr:uncharacterized protein At2g39795, mitochondrial-like [Asparagus officinalis]ONK62185.1 uncharacterized protein A4U43_C07F1260 [Asparagus officinalis]
MLTALRRATAAAAASLASHGLKATKGRTLPLRNILSLSRTLSSFSEQQQQFDLLKVLDSEIKFASEDYKKPEKFPKGFPFEIEDEKGTNAIVLRRSYGREEIEVVVSMPHLVTEEDPEDDDDDDEHDDEGENDDDGKVQFSIPLTVNISKGGMSLEVGCTAYPDEIEIDAVLVRRDMETEDEMVSCEGPRFSHLDTKLQKAIHRYLERRGISPLTMNFLYEYMVYKDNREYLFWLKNLRRFIKEQ